MKGSTRKAVSKSEYKSRAGSMGQLVKDLGKRYRSEIEDDGRQLNRTDFTLEAWEARPKTNDDDDRHRRLLSNDSTSRLTGSRLTSLCHFLSLFLPISGLFELRPFDCNLKRFVPLLLAPLSLQSTSGAWNSVRPSFMAIQSLH